MNNYNKYLFHKLKFATKIYFAETKKFMMKMKIHWEC